MSIYNMMCGNNPLFGLYARVLETQGELRPARFRDMYTREIEGKPQIVLYTRTGGGNREDYETENDALCEHPLFVTDFDDDFDSTFAHFVYRVPEQFEERMLRLHRASQGIPKLATPRQKFDRSLAAINGTNETPEAVTDSQCDELQSAIDAIVADLPDERSMLEQSV